MTMIKKVLVLLMVSTAWAAPLRPEVPIVKRFHEAMTDTDWETIPEVMTTETRETEKKNRTVGGVVPISIPPCLCPELGFIILSQMAAQL